MKKTILFLILGAALTGCASGSLPTMARMEAGRSGCDPRDPTLQPMTRKFDICKKMFPNLASDYSAKLKRHLSGDKDVTQGDVVERFEQLSLPD